MITNNSVLYNLQNIQKNIQSDSKETVSYSKARQVHIATCKFCFVNILNYFLGTVRIYDSDFKQKGGKHIDFWIVGVKELKGIITKIDSNPK